MDVQPEVGMSKLQKSFVIGTRPLQCLNCCQSDKNYSNKPVPINFKESSKQSRWINVPVCRCHKFSLGANSASWGKKTKPFILITLIV